MEPDDFVMEQVWDSVAHSLLHLGLRDGGDKDFGVMLLGNDVHVRVVGVETNAEIRIVGEAEYNDLGEQLVLACLHNLTPGDIAELSLKELNTDKDVPLNKKTQPQAP